VQCNHFQPFEPEPSMDEEMAQLAKLILPQYFKMLTSQMWHFLDHFVF